MCQASDIVQLELILESDEPVRVTVRGELDGEPFSWGVTYDQPIGIREVLNKLGLVLDAQRLGYDERPVT